MTIVNNRALLVSVKEEAAGNATNIPIAFRQVENWANGGKWLPIVLATGWANVGSGYRTAQYFVTPFGFVMCRGVCQYTGTLAAGFNTVGTFPLGVSPPMVETGMAAVTGYASMAGQWNMYPAGNLQIGFSASMTNPYVFLSSVWWAPFN